MANYRQRRSFSSDPVHHEPADGKWYFWDETWSDRHGPYDHRWRAVAACLLYCDEVLGV